MSTNVESPFNWRGKPSIFLKHADHNGVNHKRSARQTKLEKSPPVFLTGSTVYLRVSDRPMTTYSKAKAK